MGRNYLKGILGDALNAMLSCSGNEFPTSDEPLAHRGKPTLETHATLH